MKRKRFPKDIEDRVLTECGRRCALCFGLSGDISVKMEGQIAHIDRNSENAAPENAAYLCMPRRAKYDSRSMQTKGLTPGELRIYQSSVYEFLASPQPWTDLGGSIKHRVSRKVGVSLEVYDRRIKVYRATVDFIRYVLKDLKPQFSGILQFATDTEEALFLFDEAVAECLSTLFKNALRLHESGIVLTRPETVQDLRQLINEQTALAVWFSNQIKEIRATFAPFLRLA
jgi:hypothetical protein